MKHDITEKDQKRLQKIIDESVRLSLFEQLLMLQKKYPNDAEFGKEARRIILLTNTVKY